jgi:hypothetical protein
MQATKTRERRYLRTVSALVTSRQGSHYRQCSVEFPCQFPRMRASHSEVASVVLAQIRSDYPELRLSSIEQVEASIFSHKLLGSVVLRPTTSK